MSSLDVLTRQIARRIEQEMQRKGWSVNQLADFAGLGRGGVSEILRGKRYPTLRTLLKVADALEVRVKALLPDE